MVWRKACSRAQEALAPGSTANWRELSGEDPEEERAGEQEQEGEERRSSMEVEEVLVLDSDGQGEAEESSSEGKKGCEERARKTKVRSVREKVSQRGVGEKRQCRRCQKVKPIGQLTAHGTPPKQYICADAWQCIEGVSS